MRKVTLAKASSIAEAFESEGPWQMLLPTIHCGCGIVTPGRRVGSEVPADIIIMLLSSTQDGLFSLSAYQLFFLNHFS